MAEKNNFSITKQNIRPLYEKDTCTKIRKYRTLTSK